MALLDLLRRNRWLAFATALAVAPASVTGCSAEFGDEVAEYRANDGSSVDEVTDVSHSRVKRQSIGNCWIYATASWVESLRRRYAGEEINVSETYWTYWHWYSELVNGRVTGTEIETGGWWGEAANIIRERGYVMEADFIPAEANSEISQTQARALEAINASIRSGALSTPEARRNRTLVRDELDRAFGLSATVVAELDRVFGADGARTLATTRASRTIVHRPSELQIGRTRVNGSTRYITLNDVIGTQRNSWNPDQRSGTYAWQGVAYPSDSAGRARFMQRVMRALNDGHPVLISWLVDFNAMNTSGEFRLEELQRRGIGRQGGHLTVLEDYTVDLADGTYLGAGALSREDRERALTGTVRFFRIKNSWGTYRPDRPGMSGEYAGYHDLYMNYLNGPIAWSEGGNGTSQRTPLSSVILPPGY